MSLIPLILVKIYNNYIKNYLKTICHCSSKSCSPFPIRYFKIHMTNIRLLNTMPATLPIGPSRSK